MADPSRIFSLHGQGLKLDTRAEIDPHLDRLRALDDVEEVHLGGNTFGVEACRALAEVLATKSTLKVADLADIFTGRLITEIPNSLSALCDSLVHTTSLVEIDLSDNAFGGRSAEPMVNLLAHNRAIQVLKLNNNGLGPAGGAIVANALLASARASAAAGEKSNLREVICGRNRLEDSAVVWAEAYAAHGTLRSVTMQNDGIRMAAAVALINGLAKCPQLETLDLQDNTLTETTDSGAIDLSGPRLLARVLPRWPALRTLNLSDCVLKPRGGLLVAKTLANGSNPALEVLKFENSEIDEQAIAVLAEAVSAHMPRLARIDVNANKADESGEALEALRQALASNGHEDALGELDELEEMEEDEEEYLDVFPEADEAEKEEEQEPTETVSPASPKADETTVLADELAAVSIASPAPATEPAPAPAETEAAPVEAQSKPETTNMTSAAPAETAEPAATTVTTEVPTAAVSLPPSSEAPALTTANGTAEKPAPVPEPSTALPAPTPAPAPAAAAPSTPAPAPAPTKGGSVKEKTVKKRRSVFGDFGQKLAGVFSPKRRVSQAPAGAAK